MAVVVLLLACGWISITNAQPTVTLMPQNQTVCRGESISYNCIGIGTVMVLFSPPIVNQSSPLTVLSSDPVQRCPVIPNSAAAIVLVDSTASPSFLVTYTLYIPNDRSEGPLTVFCRVTATDGMVAATETTLSVLGTPSPVTTPPTFQNNNCSCEKMAQVPVNVSWDSPENAQEFMLQIIGKNMDYNITIRSLESSVTVFLPYGDYSATLCAINRCGKTCRGPDNFTVEAQRSPEETTESDTSPTIEPDSSNSVVIALAVVVGILCLLLIVACICGIILTVIVCTSKEDKSNAQDMPADETKIEMK